VKIHNLRPVPDRGGRGKFRDVAMFDVEPVDGFRILDLKLALAPDGKKFIFAPRIGGQRLATVTGEFARGLGEIVWNELEGVAHGGR
jgi:hypothetical protein